LIYTQTPGAPLGLRREEADPAYDDDPSGERIPLDAHIRLARPRDMSTESQRILRKGFNFQKGFDRAGLLDQGLAFVSYQRRLADFLVVQERLAGEPLESTRCPSAVASSSCCPGPRAPTTGWDARCWTADLTRLVRHGREGPTGADRSLAASVAASGPGNLRRPVEADTHGRPPCSLGGQSQAEICPVPHPGR